MNCLIIRNGFYGSASSLHQYQRLESELQQRGVKTEVITTAEIIAFLGEDGEVRLTAAPDFVLYLDKDPYVAAMLEKKGLRLFNCGEAIRLCDDKMLTYLALSGSGIAMPLTVASPLLYAGEDEDGFLRDTERLIGYPVVVKQCYGSLGAQVELADSPKELRAIRAKLLKIPHLYQRFVKSSCGVDVRVILVGGKAICTFKRVNDKDFRSNVERGGKGELFAAPQAYLQAAEKAAEILKLSYGAADFLIGENGEPILAEVNSNAFFVEAERVCGINVAACYADYMIKTMMQDAENR